MTRLIHARIALLAIAGSLCTSSNPQQVGPPECESFESYSIAFSLLMMDASCNVVAPEAKAVRAASLQPVRKIFGACFDALERSPEFQVQVAHAAGEVRPNEQRRVEYREYCEKYFREMPSQLLQEIKSRPSK